MRDFFNAVQLLVATLEQVQGVGTNSGLELSSATANLTFNGSGGVLQTDAAGELLFYFTLYDYSPTEASFRSVLEVSVCRTRFNN